MKQIPLFKVLMAPDAHERVAKTLQSGYIGQGPIVEAFEDVLRHHFNHDYVLTTNSCTSALHLAVHALGIKDDKSEILTSPLTCTATNWPILGNRVKLHWVDVDLETANMDLVDLERKITEHTKAIMVVHWGGYPADLDALHAIVDRCEARFGHRPIIIEDCAHAWCSTYKGRYVGTHGNWAAYSFQAIKHFTCVDGGALITPTRPAYEQMKLQRWYGIDREGSKKNFRCEEDILSFGFKFHMNDVNASIGMANFKPSLEAVKKHRDNADYYRNALKSVPGITLLTEHPDRRSAYWLFTIKAERRNDLMHKLAEAGIASSRVHERNDRHTCAYDYRAALPNLDLFSTQMLCIPVGWWVTPEDRAHIVDVIKSGW